MNRSDLVLFSGLVSSDLSESIASRLGLSLGKAKIGAFSDGEIMVEIEENVRGKDVFIVQSTSAPCNSNLMTLMLMADAVRRASAQRITAVIPYFGYARQDRRSKSARVPISAKIVADMITSVGFDRLLTVDLHADQIQGFFSIPVDNVYASSLFVKHALTQKYDKPIMVSPDVGGVVRARAVAKQLGVLDFAIIDKRRPKPNQAEVMNVIGEVSGKTCILVDDIVDTAGTLCQAATALKANGATGVVAYITHPVLSGEAVNRINASDLDRLLVTDTISLTQEAVESPKIHQFCLNELLAEAIYRVSREESISEMFV